MKKDKHKTDVKFLYHEGNEELFAYFFKDKYSSDPKLFVSYSHIGQHSACHVDFANDSRLATHEEYKDLKKELESIGYNLRISKPKTEDLFLILKGQWYEMIEAGIKREEYRDITDYFTINRGLGSREYKTVTFQLGYRSNRRMTFAVDNIRKGTGRLDWGAEYLKRYYVISLGKRIK